MYNITLQEDSDLEAIEELLDDAFGVDRHRKTAYRLREGVSPLPELCFVIRDGGKLMATLRFWPVRIRSDRGKVWPALLLGPIAVRQGHQGRGYGIALMQHGLIRAKELGHERVILVGDEEYYRRVGFSRDLARGVKMPGPVDDRRLLARELVPGAMNGVEGLMEAARPPM